MDEFQDTMQRYGLAAEVENAQFEAPSPPGKIMSQPEKEDPLAKYEDFMKNFKKQFQIN